MPSLDRLQKLTTQDDKYNLLGSWEKDFLTSLKDQVRQGRTLSVKQNDVLQKIEAKFSDKSIKKLLKWEKEWNPEKQRTARICAEYYKQSGYYSYLANRVLTEPEWIIPQESYEKLCHNKYAKKILEMTEAPPLYTTGTVVTIRATARKALTNQQFLKFKEKPLFVLEVLPQVVRAVKGAKIYRVLSGASTDVFEIEERFLKQFKKCRTV